MPMKPEHLVDAVERCDLRKPHVRRGVIYDGRGDDGRPKFRPSHWLAEWVGGDDLGEIAVSLCRYDSGNRLQAPFMVDDIDIGVTDVDLDCPAEPYLFVRLSGPVPEELWAEIDRRAAEKKAAAA